MSFRRACGVLCVAAIGLLVYSQTRAFTWDTGFHVLAAQLIRHGRRPYLDFLFPQTPLNAYWNAAWIAVFGESWRVIQAVAALTTAAAILLAAHYVFERFPVKAWRLAAAIAAIAIIASNGMVVMFATAGQAYALCLFLIVAAFRATVLAVDGKGPPWPLLAGFLAGAAASSSLLTAPVGPVLLIWMLVYNRTGSRWAKLAAFASGAMVSFLPLLWLFHEGPRQVVFNVFSYHFYYRKIYWDDAIPHDLELMTRWIDSGQTLLLLLLAGTGLLFLRRGEWDRKLRAEYYLCGWLSLAVTVHLLTAHPTFVQYFLLVVPFLAILATVGLYWAGSSLSAPDRPFWPTVALIALLSFALGRRIYFEDRKTHSWLDMEKIASKVAEVTPPGTPFLAEQEDIYFLTRRTPPFGAELDDSHKLTLAPDLAALLHVVPEDELERQIQAGAFGTYETCAEPDEIERLGLARIYAHQAEAADCKVFWDPAEPRP